MLGQLCPPGLLVAISVLETMFFTQHGIVSVSASYAQQTDPVQDAQALRALRRLLTEFLPPQVERHIVLYAYMGVFPVTPRGARRLLEAAADLAVRAGAERLIVKTTAEAHRIPTVEENVRALETAGAIATRRADLPDAHTPHEDDDVYTDARAFIEAVLDLGDDVGRGLRAAFRRGYLDVPYCLHPDNAGRSRALIDERGRLRWSAIGAMPIRRPVHATTGAMTSTRLLKDLHHVAHSFDHH